MYYDIRYYYADDADIHDMRTAALCLNCDAWGRYDEVDWALSAGVILRPIDGPRSSALLAAGRGGNLAQCSELLDELDAVHDLTALAYAMLDGIAATN